MSKSKPHSQKTLNDEHVQQQIIGWIRKYGVYEFTGFSKVTKKQFKKACFDGIVSKRTFYNFLNDDPEFKEKCLAAKKYFRQTLFAKDPDLRQDVIDKLTNLGRKGFVRKKKKITIQKNKAGDVTSTTETIEEDIMPPPFWAVRMLLGNLESDKEPDEHPWMEP